MDGFTALAFGFCAAVTTFYGEPLVDFGNIVAGECQTFALIGESYGDTAAIQGHNVGVSFFANGAELSIDGRKFILPKTAKL